MKTWNLLPKNKFFQALKETSENQKGQTIVEFVLLLFVITLISYGFVAVLNGNLARYWEYSASLIVNDKPTKDPRFKLSN